MSLGSACLNSSYCLEACTGSCVPQPAHHEPLASIYEGDCVAVMAEFPEASVDAIVTDPPYSLGFMGKAWDVQVEHAPWARAAYRVLKPGGHLLAFGGSRTYHRLACAIEDAGFEVRDCLMWLYSQGFPKPSASRSSRSIARSRSRD